ncbi:MAG: hypothetical protein KY462_12840 [Actinobacteria bacterium]|nr:hypothetical protein [Actinomycetota bacterium]
MTRAAIPEVKDTLRGLDSADCRDAVEHAIEQATDGPGARRILQQRLDL